MKVCGNPDSGLLVIQAMDARQLERLEDEVRALQDMGGALPLWAAFAVEDWNDTLSPWPAPPVFGGHGFGGRAEEDVYKRQALSFWGEKSAFEKIFRKLPKKQDSCGCEVYI